VALEQIDVRRRVRIDEDQPLGARGRGADVARVCGYPDLGRRDPAYGRVGIARRTRRGTVVGDDQLIAVAALDRRQPRDERIELGLLAQERRDDGSARP
jgi:hypothetical protein